MVASQKKNIARPAFIVHMVPCPVCTASPLCTVRAVRAYAATVSQIKDQVLDIHSVQLSVQLSAMDPGMLEDFIEATQGVRQNDLHVAMQELFAQPAIPATQEAALTGERVDFWEKFCVDFASDESGEEGPPTCANSAKPTSVATTSATITLPAVSPTGVEMMEALSPSELLEQISTEVEMMQVQIRDSGVLLDCRVFAERLTELSIEMDNMDLDGMKIRDARRRLLKKMEELSIKLSTIVPVRDMGQPPLKAAKLEKKKTLDTGTAKRPAQLWTGSPKKVRSAQAPLQKKPAGAWSQPSSSASASTAVNQAESTADGDQAKCIDSEETLHYDGDAVDVADAVGGDQVDVADAEGGDPATLTALAYRSQIDEWYSNEEVVHVLATLPIDALPVPLHNHGAKNYTLPGKYASITVRVTQQCFYIKLVPEDRVSAKVLQDAMLRRDASKGISVSFQKFGPARAFRIAQDLAERHATQKDVPVSA